MPFSKTTFQNSPSVATPITAAELDKLGTQYAAALADVAAGIGDSGSDIGAALSATFAAGIHIEPTGTNDQAVINAAVLAADAAGLTEVWLRAGVYAWDADIAPWTVGVALRAENPGATTIQLGAAVTYGPRWAGVKTQIGGDSEVATVAAGARTITTSADRSALIPAGSIVLISTNEPFASRTYYMIGEWAEVASVSGTTVNLRWPLRNTYTSGGSYGIRVYRFDLLAGAGMEGIEVVASASATGRQIGVQFSQCDAPKFTRCVVRGEKFDTGVQFVECRSPLALEPVAINVMDLANPATTGYTGYGIHTIGCLDAKIIDPSGQGNRHTFDDSALSRTAPSLRTRVVRGRAYDNHGAGWSTHGGSDECVFEDCVSVNSGGGFVLRGRAPIVRGGSVRGVTFATTNAYTALGAGNQSSIHGVLIGEAPEAGAVASPAGTNVNINIDIIDVTGGAGSPIAAGIAIDTDTPLVGASIQWGEIRGHIGNAIRFWGTSITRTRVGGGKIKTATSNTSVVFDIDPTVASGGTTSGGRSVAGYNQRGLTIENIDFDGYGNDIIRLIGNASGSTAGVVSDDILITGVRAVGKNTANAGAMRIGGGNFNATAGSVRIFNNQSREHGTFCNVSTSGQAPAAGSSSANATSGGLTA